MTAIGTSSTGREAALEQLTRLEQELAVSEAGSLALAKRDFREYLRYVKLLDSESGLVIPYQEWGHLRALNGLLMANDPLIAVLKAGQVGVSVDMAAYATFIALTIKGSYCALFSQGEKEAQKLLGKCRFVWANLPAGLQEPLGADSKSELSFPSLGSSIEAMPSTENAGRGTPTKLAFFDEAEFHKYMESNYYAVKSRVESAKGQIVFASTPDPFKMDTFFKKIYRGAPANGYRTLFIGWQARPGRDQTWYDTERRSYPDQEKFQKENPGSEEEALAPPSTISAFPYVVLDAMRQDCREPLEVLQGVTHIWQKWYTGKKYVAFTDTSHGVGADDAVTVILDASTGYVVADVHSNLIPPETLALYSVELLARYGNPVWGIEDNDWGELTVKKAQALRYPRLYYRAEGQPGWHTNERTRLDLWGDLLEAVGKRLLTVPSQAGLAQFYSVIRNPKKEGRIEAQEGAKDDYPFAVAGAWQLRYRAVATHGQPPAAVNVPLEFQRNPAGRAPGLRW